jgi:hypothetical protein
MPKSLPPGAGDTPTTGACEPGNTVGGVGAGTLTPFVNGAVMPGMPFVMRGNVPLAYGLRGSVGVGRGCGADGVVA